MEASSSTHGQAARYDSLSCQQRSRLTCGFGISLEAARDQSFAVVASGLRVVLRLSFRNGRFRPIGHPNHGRKLLWDKKQNSMP